ncbi:hypothetical protein LIPSTDRAFT_68770 [Lipomyces starkeyi NRRL Y-11557]|uniref:Uncharacterized protein n=1 Tax=Lipomyces starkeyi NRRL Y-11557 TaxID=675824 RepID=A0A1E3QAK3_LIPST|nr:hypothetical protein LIPSTDRAFT_68770 [Lipomyces starkeyi NRRL Y-11557]
MSEEEKEALKASEADPEIAMSNLYTSMSADIQRPVRSTAKSRLRDSSFLSEERHSTTMGQPRPGACYSCNMMNITKAV